MELEELIVAAEEAVVAAEEAVVAVEEAVTEAGDGASEELTERARKLRGKREDAAEDEKETAEEARKREADEELSKEEEEEIRSVRSIAKTYGMTKTVDDLVKLGARAKEVKAAVRSAVLKSGATPSATSSDIKPSKRSASAPVLDTNAIYARRNARS